MDVKRNYLNGQWVGGGEMIDVVSPATAQPIAKVATVSREQVRQALADAQAAFEPWRALPAKARADYLLAIAADLSRRGDEIAKLVTQENGKPFSQSRGEVAISIDHLRWFAEHSGWGRELGSEGLDSFLETKHVSIGVIE